MVAPEATPALERCVGDAAKFFERYWAESPLLHEQPGRSFDDLASLGDLDAMVSSLGLGASRLRMVRSGAPVPVAAYTTSPGKGPRAGEAPVDAAAVMAHFDDGATIVLESLHRYWEPLTDFCRDLELALGHRLQVNAYITPPGSQGFDVHRDSHDVFVLQISGSKHWLVYDRTDDGQVLIDQDLTPGMSLYIPKGFPHAATTGDSASAHLTVGILTHDSIDVVREVVKLAEQEPSFAERLPGDAASDPVVLREVVVRRIDELKSWLDKVDVDDVTERMARRVMTSAQPILRGQLHQLQLLEHLNATTELRRRRGATCRMFSRGTELKVFLVDRELTMPLALEPAMEEISARDQFAVRDLHPLLTPGSALVLVRRLVKEGLLEVVVDG